MAITTTIGGLEAHGLNPRGRVYRNPTTSMLYTHALQRGDARLAEGGPLVVDTGHYTGRSPKDRFVVREPGSEERVWWGDVNQPLEEESFEARQARRAPRGGRSLRRRRIRRR
jgi:phosphoenolpyruvate carboxykinase (ATP)